MEDGKFKFTIPGSIENQEALSVLRTVFESGFFETVEIKVSIKDPKTKKKLVVYTEDKLSVQQIACTAVPVTYEITKDSKFAPINTEHTFTLE